MQTLITPFAMRDMEKRYFEKTGTPSIDLMERAARALFGALTRRFGLNRRYLFACGPGGNGGDGYACARMIAQAGGRCAVIPAAPPTSPDAAENLRRAREAGVDVLSVEEWLGREHDAPEVWVDALYGTGLSRAPSGAAAGLIRRMNADRQRGSAVAAVDIPSGLQGETGAAHDPCVRANVTCTFQFAKTGHCLADGLDVCGALEVLDIGIPEAFFPENAPALMDDGDVSAHLPRRPRNLHKGQAGRLLIVAGSVGMAGAAALCARAALRSGAGLVTIACPERLVPILQTLCPCAMCAPLEEADGAISSAALPALAKALQGKDAVVCGCGLSRRAAPEAVALVLNSGLPALLDADALNLISESDALRAALRPHHLITPHPGEAARLLRRPADHPLRDALALTDLHCQALLKGAATVIPVNGTPWISASGGCGMARGGSGDCLSGIIGALMADAAARGIPLTGEALARCAAVGSEIHGRAGELAQARLGTRGMCAQDIVDALPEALMGYERPEARP